MRIETLESKADDKRKARYFLVLLLVLVCVIGFYSDCNRVEAQAPSIRVDIVNTPEFNLALESVDNHYHLFGVIAASDTLGFAPDSLIVMNYPDTVYALKIGNTEANRHALKTGAIIHSFLFDLDAEFVKNCLSKPGPSLLAIVGNNGLIMVIKIMEPLKLDLLLAFGITKDII